MVWSGDLSQTPTKETTRRDRTARACHTRMHGAACCCCCWAVGLSFRSQLGVSMPSACTVYVLLLLTVACRLWAVLCSYDTNTHSKQQHRGIKVEQVVWLGDRSQDPIKTTRHSTARTCQTRMMPPDAASGWQGCSFVVSWG